MSRKSGYGENYVEYLEIMGRKKGVGKMTRTWVWVRYYEETQRAFGQVWKWEGVHAVHAVHAVTSPSSLNRGSEEKTGQRGAEREADDDENRPWLERDEVRPEMRGKGLGVGLGAQAQLPVGPSSIVGGNVEMKALPTRTLLHFKATSFAEQTSWKMMGVVLKDKPKGKTKIER